MLHVRCRWIESDDCKNTYYFKCIPKKHLDEDDEELQFLCHFCAKDVDSDNDPFVLSEIERDDD